MEERERVVESERVDERARVVEVSINQAVGDLVERALGDPVDMSEKTRQASSVLCGQLVECVALFLQGASMLEEARAGFKKAVDEGVNGGAGGGRRGIDDLVISEGQFAAPAEWPFLSTGDPFSAVVVPMFICINAIRRVLNKERAARGDEQLDFRVMCARIFAAMSGVLALYPGEHGVVTIATPSPEALGAVQKAMMEGGVGEGGGKNVH